MHHVLFFSSFASLLAIYLSIFSSIPQSAATPTSTTTIRRVSLKESKVISILPPSPRLDYIFNGSNVIKKIAEALSPIPDKFTAHSYQTMYGTHLMPFIEKFRLLNQKLKFLEIGLGCDMRYGPGKSIKLWQNVLNGNDYELWFAELDHVCVQQCQSQLQDVKVLIGDQGNRTTLHSWIDISKGQFDVIIDDGGHRNHQLITSLSVLWPEVTPGGFYFLEDLQVGRIPPYIQPNGTPAIVEIIHAWIEYLLVSKKYPGTTPHHLAVLLKEYPIPADVDLISCQLDACVLHKAE